MFDAKSLLDQFLGGGNAQGGFSGSGGQQSQRGGFDLSQIGNKLPGGLGGALGGLGGVGGGAIAGSLATLLLTSKKGRKLGGSALQLGGMAVVGALAYRAFQNYQAGKQPQVSASGGVPALPAPEGTPFNPVGEADQQRLGLNLMRAMIAAAKADGHVDAAEQSNIFAQLDRLALDTEAKAFVIDELRAPLDVDAVARDVRTPEEAAEIYTASLLAINVDNPAERGYLALLAARLNLEDALVQHLHKTVEGMAETV
jgi:uncharacterized membrane protein YebE (DUF533 family)